MFYTEAYWVQINVRSKNILSTKLLRAQNKFTSKEILGQQIVGQTKWNTQQMLGPLKCQVQTNVV